jgi:hypothetical protein
VRTARAKLFKRGVGGVLGAAAGEPAQHLLGLRRAQPQRGGVADHLVVLLFGQGEDLLDQHNSWATSTT